MSWLGSFFSGGYRGAQWSRERQMAAFFRSWMADEDHHLGSARDTLRLEGRDMDRNNAILFGAVNRVSRYSMPTLRYRFNTPDAAWNKDAEDFLKWWDTSKACDIRGLSTLTDLSRLGIREGSIQGDGGFILHEEDALEPVESERIRTPQNARGRRIIDGVELNKHGRPVAFWVCPRGTSGLPDESKAKRIPANAFVFFRHAGRFDQVRGVPPIAAVIPDLIDQQEFHGATVSRAKLEAFMGGVLKLLDPLKGGGGNPFGGMLNRNKEANAPPVKQPPAVFNVKGLKLLDLAPGEDYSHIPPVTPSGREAEFEAMLIRQIAAGFGIPYEFMMLDLRGVSWSCANAIVKMAGDAFRDVHHWAVNSYLRPIINWRLLRAIEKRELPPAPVARNAAGVEASLYHAYDLGVPEYLWADEAEHIKAAKDAWLIGAKSLDDIAAERGETALEMLTRKGNDIRMAIRLAQQLEKETGEIVSWDQLISASQPGQTSMAEIAKREEVSREKAV